MSIRWGCARVLAFQLYSSSTPDFEFETQLQHLLIQPKFLAYSFVQNYPACSRVLSCSKLADSYTKDQRGPDVCCSGGQEPGFSFGLVQTLATFASVKENRLLGHRSRAGKKRLDQRLQLEIGLDRKSSGSAGPRAKHRKRQYKVRFKIFICIAEIF